MRGRELLALARNARLHPGLLFISPHGVGDFGQVAATSAGHDGRYGAAVAQVHRGQTPNAGRQAILDQARQDGLVERGDTIVGKAGGLRPEHRHRLGGLVPGFAIALNLFRHIAHRVECALAIKLVDRHKVGEVEHIDFFELARRTKFRRHHVETQVDIRHDRRIALTNARGFNNDQVKATGPTSGNRVGQGAGNFATRLARCHRTHVDARAPLAGTQPIRSPGMDRIHADTVAQQGPPALASAGVNREDGNAQAIALIEAKPANQLIGERTLASSAGTRDPQNRGPRQRRSRPQGVAPVGRDAIGFDRCDQTGQGRPVPR